MAESPPIQDSHSEARKEGAFLTGIPGYLATLCLGSAALALPAAAYIPAVQILAYIDLPFALFCFFVSAIIGFGSRQKLGWVLAGVLMGTLGVTLAAMHLLLFHNHPWLS